MSSFKNLYIIIFKKINNKIGTKSLASKHIIDPRHNYKKTRLLKDSCIKGTLIKIKPEPEKEHAVISKTKCVVHNIGKNGNKPKMVFRKKMQLDFVPFLDNPFMWLKGLYKNVYIDDDERIGTKYKVMPPLCSMPVVATNKNNFCAIHKSAKVLDSKSDTPVFDTEKSFSPSSTNSPSVKNISVVTKDISCSTLDERSILATCLCVLPLEQNKISSNKDIKEQQTNDKLKTIDNNASKAQEENVAVHDYYQTFKNYPSEINNLLASKSKDNEPVTVLRVNVEDIKSQISDPESTKDQAMTKMFTLENNDKINLTLLLDADELHNRKSHRNRESPKVVVSQTQQKPDCIEHIIRNYKVNLQSTLGECDLSSLSNLGGKKNPPKKDEKKDKPAINKTKSTSNNTLAKPKQPAAKTVTAVKKKPTNDTKICTVPQSQPQPQPKSQQQTIDAAPEPQDYWQMAPMQTEQMYYYYWPMPSQTYNEASAWPNYEQQKGPLHMLNSNTVQPQTPDTKTNAMASQASNQSSQWQNYEQQNRPTATTKSTPTPTPTPTSTPTIRTPNTLTKSATVSNQQLPDSKNTKQDTSSTSKNITAAKQESTNANITTAQPDQYAQAWPANYMEAYNNNAFAEQQNFAHSWYTAPTQQQTFEQCAQQIYPQMMQQQPNQTATEQHVQIMQEPSKNIVTPPQPAVPAKSETIPKKQKKKSTTEKITSTLIQFLNRTGSANNPETKKQTSAGACTVTNTNQQQQKQETVQQPVLTSGQETSAQETCAQPVLLAASFVPLSSTQLSNPVHVQHPAYNASAWGEAYGQACNNQQLQTFAQMEQPQPQFTQQQIEAANANSWQFYNQPYNEPNSQQIDQHTNEYMAQQSPERVMHQTPEKMVFSQQSEHSQDKTENSQQSLEQVVFSQQMSNEPVNLQENTENTQQTLEQIVFSQQISNQPVNSQESTENTHQNIEQIALSQQMSYQPINTQENTQQQQQQFYNKETVAQQHNDATWPENYAQSFYSTAHQEEPEKANNLIASQSETYMNTEAHQPGDKSSAYSDVFATAVHENWKKQYMQNKSPAIDSKQTPVLNSAKVDTPEKTISSTVEKKNSTKPANSIVANSTSNSENQPPAAKMQNILTKTNSGSITQKKNPWQPSDPFASKNTTPKQDNMNKTENVLSVKQLEKGWPQNTQETYNVATSLKQDDLAKINHLLTEKQVTRNAEKWQEKSNEVASKKNTFLKSDNVKNTPNLRGMYTANWQTFVKNPLESKITDISVNKIKQEVTSAKKEITSVNDPTMSTSNWQKMFETSNKADIPTKIEIKSGSTLQELGAQTSYSTLTDETAGAQRKMPDITAKSNQQEITLKSSTQNQQQLSSEWSQNAQHAYNSSSAKWNEQQTQQNVNLKEGNNVTEMQQQLQQQSQQFSAPWQAQNCYPTTAQHQQQQSATPQEYSSQYNASSQQQYYYNPQTGPWQQQTSSHQYHTLNEAIAQQKLRPVQSEHELQQNYKLLDSYSMLDTKTDLYRVKDVKMKSPEYHKTNEVPYVPKYKSGLIDKVEKHYFCWKEHFFDKSNILQNSKNIDIVKHFEETLEQIKNIDNTVATVDNPEVFLTMPVNEFDIEDPNKEKVDDKKTFINANQLYLPVSEVTDKNEPLKTVVREEEFKSDDMEMLSKIDTFVDAKPKLNTEKVMMKSSDSFLLSKQLKDFPNIAKRKLHIQNVENVDLEEMCKHSSLLLNCRIVLDGSERNEPNTTLHAKVYDYKEKRDGFIMTPPRNKK